MSLLVLVTGAAVLTPLFGITGAALSTAISMIVWAICLVGPARRGVGFHPGPLPWLTARAMGREQNFSALSGVPGRL